jgi:photosystem II stability/assembly factor-like uncharacterized protein
LFVLAACLTSVQGVAAAAPVTATSAAAGSIVAKPPVGPSNTTMPRARFNSQDGPVARTLTADGTWTWQNPLPEGNPLFSISCPTTSACFAAGSDGRLLATTDGGATWVTKTSGTQTGLNAISCADASHCVAVGDFGEVVYTANGLFTTTTTNSGNFLSGVSCPTTTICYAVGASGSTLKTSDGGATWAPQVPVTANDLFSVSCVSTTQCNAAGASGTIAFTGNGNSWILVGSGGDDLYGIYCASIYCWAVGQNGTFLSSDNPSCCWSPGDVGYAVPLISVSCSGMCFAAGLDGNVYIRGGLQSGTVPGRGTASVNGSLYGMACPNSTTCYTVGAYGVIAKTTNAGTGWATTSPLGSAEFGVSCPSTTTCIAVGFAGAIAATTNGGTSWSGQASGTSADLNSVSCPSTTTCFAAGDGAIVATTNGGGTWGNQTPPFGGNIQSISCTDTSHCFAVTDSSVVNFFETSDGSTWTGFTISGSTAPTGVACPTTVKCFVTDGSLILSTTNAGATWSVSFDLATDPDAGVIAPFAAITCPTTTNCYAVGGAGLVAATSDGGLNWRTDSSRTAAELSAISCPSAGTCYAALYEDLGSTILTTTNFGGTWVAQYGGGTNQFAYTSISCASTTTCVAIGYGGVASTTTTAGAAWTVQQPTGSTNVILNLSCASPSECYAAGGDTLFSTHDGGATWSTHVLATTDQMAGISCPVTNTCFAVGWPGAIYITTDGGSTWTPQANYLYGSDTTLLGVSCSSTTTCAAVGSHGTIVTTTDGATWNTEASGTTTIVWGVSCPTGLNCVATGSGGLTMARSAGAWHIYASGTTQNLHSVSCPSTAICFTVGNAGTILRTANGGSNWTPQTSGTTDNLFGISCAQTAACLATGNFGTVLGTFSPGSWSAIGVPTGNALIAAAFEDINHAWVAGNGGSILANPLITRSCATLSLNPNPTSPQLAGTPVVLTAVATGCPTPNYRFWIRPPGGSWAIVQDYSASGTYNWNSTTTVGTYGIEVDARDASESTSYDLVVTISYTMNAVPPCANAGLSASPPSPSLPGTQVIFTATSTTCPNPRYRFWEAPPGGGWTIVQNYSASTTFTWNSQSTPGTYRFEVDVRDAAETTPYDVTALTSYVLQSVPPCTTPGLSASPPSPGATGSGATFTATTSGCPNPRYRFWVQPPGGAWAVAQAYGSANMFVWLGGSVAGTYRIEVDVRDASETVSYDAVTVTAYTLAGCSSVTLGATPASPSAPGTSVLFTGTATCPGTATYRFWIRPPGGAWTVKQNYATTNTFNWTTSGLAAGNYGVEVDVRNQGSTASYEAVKSTVYVLGVTPCTAPSLSATPVSPGPTGASVTFTATTTGCPTPNYRFWIQSPGGAWTIVRNYSATNTFVWTGTGAAGVYHVEVDVRDASETVSYDAVANATYQLNGCTVAGITANPASGGAHGTTIVLTATSTCPGTASYRFWIKAPGGSWTVVQDYGASNTFNWTPSVAGTYYLEVDVRDQGATASYEAVANISYAVT